MADYVAGVFVLSACIRVATDSPLYVSENLMHPAVLKTRGDKVASVSVAYDARNAIKWRVVSHRQRRKSTIFIH